MVAHLGEEAVAAALDRLLGRRDRRDRAHRRALRHLDGERVGGRARAGEDAARAAAVEVDDLVLDADALELELEMMAHVTSHTCNRTSPQS